MADATLLRDKLRRFATEVHRVATEDLMLPDLRDGAPEITGELRRGIEYLPGGSPEHPSGTMRSNSPQGNWREEGTRAHLILPRGAKALRFVVGGDTVFATRVDHPGNPPMPWFRPVVERWGDYLQRAASQVTVS